MSENRFLGQKYPVFPSKLPRLADGFGPKGLSPTEKTSGFTPMIGSPVSCPKKSKQEFSTQSIFSCMRRLPLNIIPHFGLMVK